MAFSIYQSDTFQSAADAQAVGPPFAYTIERVISVVTAVTFSLSMYPHWPAIISIVCQPRLL